MKLNTCISMHSALTTETPEFFLMQVLSDYPCTVVRYHPVRYGTVLYKVTNMSRGRFSIGDKGQSFLFISQTYVPYCIIHYSICQVDFPYGTVRYTTVPVLLYETCCGFLSLSLE